MTVIFDEVIATIDPPSASAPEPDETEDSGGTDNNEKQILSLWEEQQRRAKRLLAD